MKRLTAILATLLLLTGAASAADWNFYGSARISTFHTDFEKDPFNSGADTENYEQNLNGNSRIGARVKVSDTLSGRFEYGALGGDANIRILWGEWNFGPGKLGIGQHYTPLLFAYSNQVYNMQGFNKGDLNMSAFGMLYGKRKAMVRLKFGSFQIAAVEPIDTYSNKAYLEANLGYSTETRMPAIQARYKYEQDNWHLQAAGGYCTFDIINGTEEYAVNSWVAAIGGRVNVGAAYFKGNLWTGVNAANLNAIMVSNDIASAPGELDGDGLGYAVFNGSEVIDKDAFGALIVAGYAINKGLHLEAGYGYVKTEEDTGGATKDDIDTYYIQSTIFLAPGVFLTPEVGRYNMNQDNADVIYYGIKWQINF